MIINYLLEPTKAKVPASATKMVGIYRDDIQFDAWTYFGFSTEQRCLFLLLQHPALTMARSVSLLPMALLALGAWMLSSLTQSGFVMNSATPRGSKVAMRGFKDDFYAWKETLSSEDQALLLKQAQNATWQKFRSILLFNVVFFFQRHIYSIYSCSPWQLLVSRNYCSSRFGIAYHLRSSTRSSALLMSSRRASLRTRLSPSERSCRNSSTMNVRTTRRTGLLG